MRWVSSQMRGGRTDYSEIIIDANDQLRAAGLQPDESYIRDAVTLQAVSVETQKAVILMSAQLGKARLIDNQVVELTQQAASAAETAES
jgi:pantoate--beta-alanine ligase